MIRRLLPLAVLALTCGCASQEPGTGWSRAPDLSVYAAMQRAAQLARERDILCHGGNPAVVADTWRAVYGAREEWIAYALASRYGPAALAQARIDVAGREICPTIADNKWHEAHIELLRTLELRLYPRETWRAAALR